MQKITRMHHEAWTTARLSTLRHMRPAACQSTRYTFHSAKYFTQKQIFDFIIYCWTFLFSFSRTSPACFICTCISTTADFKMCRSQLAGLHCELEIFNSSNEIQRSFAATAYTQVRIVDLLVLLNKVLEQKRASVWSLVLCHPIGLFSD